MTYNLPMDENNLPTPNKKKYVRGLSIFLVLVLFLPPLKDALDIKLFMWHDSYITLWRVFVVLGVMMLLPALMFDENEKIDIGLFKKFFKDE